MASERLTPQVLVGIVRHEALIYRAEFHGGRTEGGVPLDPHNSTQDFAADPHLDEANLTLSIIQPRA